MSLICTERGGNVAVHLTGVFRIETRGTHIKRSHGKKFPKRRTNTEINNHTAVLQCNTKGKT